MFLFLLDFYAFLTPPGKISPLTCLQKRTIKKYKTLLNVYWNLITYPSLESFSTISFVIHILIPCTNFFHYFFSMFRYLGRFLISKFIKILCMYECMYVCMYIYIYIYIYAIDKSNIDINTLTVIYLR